MNIPSPADVFAAFFAADRQAEPAVVTFGPCDQVEPDPDEPAPFTLTGQAEAALDGPEPEPEAEP
jgi:hypothetical protein